MTKSRSEEKRPYALVPQRVWKDRRLTNSDIRVLGAMGCYVNRAGVCWPGVKTLQADTDIDAGNISKIIKRIVEFGYVRRLEPNDYDQVAGAWGMSNRYQVLMAGNETLPAYEEMANANLFQVASDQVTTKEGSGARGEPDTTPATNRTITAYESAVERMTGVRPAQADRGVATRLNHQTPAAIDAAVRTMIAGTGRVPTWRELEAWLQAG